jgi:poly(hydroxyalkanoate) depolymerase family esterase
MSERTRLLQDEGMEERSKNGRMKAMPSTQWQWLRNAAAFLRRTIGRRSPAESARPLDAESESRAGLESTQPPVIDHSLRPTDMADMDPSLAASRIAQAAESAPGLMPGAHDDHLLWSHMPEGLQFLFTDFRRLGALLGEGWVPALPRREPADAGLFLARTYTDSAGSRDYRLYVPRSYNGQPMPLIVMLHGCNQTAEDLAAGTRMNAYAEMLGCLVVYPVQSSVANASRCWNWFNPGDQRRGRGEPALIVGITRTVMGDFAVDRRRVYAAGLSAGAAAAAILGMAYADLFAAIGVHSGLACGAATDLASAFAAMRQGEPPSPFRAASTPAAPRRIVPTIVFHGDQDTTVHPRNGDHVIDQLRSELTRNPPFSISTQRGRVPSGHAYSRMLHEDERGVVLLEQWTVHGAGHAWSGGSPEGSFTDPKGPDATREMLRFFLAHAHPGPHDGEASEEF